MSTSEMKPKFKLGYSEYVLFPDDGRRHEIIDGDHFMNPAPNLYHQHVSKRLQHQLYTKIDLAGRGTMYNAPVDVQLSDHDIVQPDLVVVLKDGRAQFTPAKIKGPPDLVIEILSPSTEQNDLHLKRSVYQRAGVREYWIVDPTVHEIRQLVLNNNEYEPQPVGEEIRMAILPEITIPLREIW